MNALAWFAAVLVVLVVGPFVVGLVASYRRQLRRQRVTCAEHEARRWMR
jgi:hypothetical protein